MTTLDPKAVDAAIDTKLVGQFWPGETALESEDHNWQQYRRERYEQIITAYLAALSSIPAQPGFGPGDDSDPPLTALKYIAEDGSLPDKTRRDARVAATEINRLRALTPHPAAVAVTDEMVERALKASEAGGYTAGERIAFGNGNPARCMRLALEAALRSTP